MSTLGARVGTLAYPRSLDQRRTDRDNARANEDLVGSWLGGFKTSHLDATDEMDFILPPVAIDVKEKRQPLSRSWPLPTGCSNEDAFVLDELSIRRALEHHPGAYFIIHDFPLGRWFLARVDEVVCADRVRLDRRGPTGIDKGKWVVNLSHFRRLHDPAAEIMPAILGDLAGKRWTGAACLMPTGGAQT